MDKKCHMKYDTTMRQRKPTNMTIDPEVIQAIDEIVEHSVYRSRSHAVETALREWIGVRRTAEREMDQQYAEAMQEG